MKNTYIRIRLTDEEKQTIKEQAYGFNITISEYIRGLIYDDIEKGADNGTKETI